MSLSANRGCTGCTKGCTGMHASLVLLAARGCTGMHHASKVHPMHPQSRVTHPQTGEKFRNRLALDASSKASPILNTLEVRA